MAWEEADRVPSAQKALEALAPHRQGAGLAREFVQRADALEPRLKRADAEAHLARARQALGQQPPLFEAAALQLLLALELEANRQAIELIQVQGMLGQLPDAGL